MPKTSHRFLLIGVISLAVSACTNPFEQSWANTKESDTLLDNYTWITNFRLRPPLDFELEDASAPSTHWRYFDRKDKGEFGRKLGINLLTMVDGDPKDLCQTQINLVTSTVAVKDLKSTYEYGNIEGKRFCKGSWTATIPLKQEEGKPAQSLPMHGFCFVGIRGGTGYMFSGMAPQNKSLAALEQSVYSFRREDW